MNGQNKIPDDGPSQLFHYNMKTFVSLLTTSALILCSCAGAPQPVAEESATVFNADGTVTFNYRNDSAQSVQLDVQFAGRHDMLRDSITGLWSLTLGPAEADMYPYCYVVDGVSIMDPRCDEFFPNEGFKNSLLDIPGRTAPLIHSIQNVPHGEMSYVTYYSNTLGVYNNALVYTPPTYKQGDKGYPVFYLISGTTDTEEVYYKVGRVNYILDNLIAQGAAQDMIVVLPYGNPSKLLSEPVDFMRDLFSQDLINDLMPYVEANYRTINDRDHRAIGGFSRGGNQGLMNGLMNLDKFSYLCSYSSFTSTALPKVYDNAKQTNSLIHLFWLGVGTDDFLYGTARDYMEFLDQKGIRNVKEFTYDKFGHTWMNAKYFLDKTLRLLFNPEASEVAMQNGISAPAKTEQDSQFTPAMMARLFPKPLVSPEFAEEGVTFRIKAEKASCVLLEGEMLKEPMPMEKDSDGVWNVTLKELTPDIYCYNFIVNGTKVMDPTNMYLVPESGFKRSILEIPGNPYAINREEKITYTPFVVRTAVDSNGMSYKYGVCEPAGAINGQCPTITLVCGANDTFESWQKVGRASFILDQMIAAGKCRPCRLVYTDRNHIPSDATHVINCVNTLSDWPSRRQALISMLCNEIK